MNLISHRFAPHLDRTMNVLLSDHDSIRELLSLLGNDNEHFFDFADLRKVDLSGQDLRGYTFYQADLTGANLENAQFDDAALDYAIPQKVRMPNPLLRGSALYPVDAKGRLTLARQFCNQLFHQDPERRDVLISLHPHFPCLTLSSVGQLDYKASLPEIETAEALEGMRLSAAQGEVRVVDSTGRILLPDFLRYQAGIGEFAFLYGALAYIEVWAPDRLLENPEVHAAMKDTCQSLLEEKGIKLADV